MNAFTIAGLVGIGIILVGILIAVSMVWLSKLVTHNQLTLTAEQTAYNPAVTLGHQIPLDASVEEQRRAARKEAAQRAAALPRWGNFGIGSQGNSTLRTASQNLTADPQSAVRIAEFHTWQGARTGIPAPGQAEAPVAVAAAPVVATKSPEDLKPGVDYPEIEITDNMSPDEVRKARIANAKARSAAIKALKEAGGAADGVEAGAAAAVAAVAAPVVSVPEPDYVEITDNMSPDEVRRARIANAKMKSAHAKAVKEAEAAAPAPVPAQAPVAGQAPAATRAPAAPPPAVSIPEPDYIEITDSMSPDEVRQARISNAKAKSAYTKALKEAGVTQPVAETTAAGTPAAAAAQPASSPAPAAPPAVEPALPKPDLIEITDDMSPDEIRQARISNAKAKSAYKKALKDAGIDPSTVELD